MAATVAIMAWVELFTNAAITNIPTITSAVADARANHLAACIKSATMTANFTVVNWLTFSSTTGPPRLTNTAMHSRARHFTRCFLMAFANTNVATIGKITVVDGKAEGARSLEARIASTIVCTRTSERAFGIVVTMIISSVAVVKNIACNTIASIPQIAGACCGVWGWTVAHSMLVTTTM
jgi:hypothetical protein